MNIRLQNTDYMEAPCMCDCGTWFELEEGYGSNDSNKVICQDCHKKEEKVSELENDIRDLENEISDAEYTLKHSKPKLEELKKKLAELQ